MGWRANVTNRLARARIHYRDLDEDLRSREANGADTGARCSVHPTPPMLGEAPPLDTVIPPVPACRGTEARSVVERPAVCADGETEAEVEGGASP